MTRTTTALLALAAAAVALAACGGDETTAEDYGASMRATMSGLTEAYGDAGAATTKGAGAGGGDTAAVVRQLEASQLALRDAANQLDDIEAPEELARDHEALVEGVRDMADAVDLLIEAQELAERDPKAAERAARQFSTDGSFDRVASAAARLEEAGVDTGL